jgi:nitroimidazol reductase NimA-like FMN-containing flavoprotein (pyridoxamine 5'-phosphate oxidase superfamily)
LVRFRRSEKIFLERNDLGRLATIGPDGFPHVVPVSYLHYRRKIWVAVDYGTQKLRNMLRDKRVGFVVDEYNPNRGIMIQGTVKIIESGEEYREIYKMFTKKFAWVRAAPWKEGEAAFISIQVLKKASWGFNR